MQFQGIDTNSLPSSFSFLVQVLRRASVEVVRKNTVQLASISNFNISEWRVVTGLYVFGKCSQKSLVDWAGDDQAQVSRCLWQLKEKDLVQSEASRKDRRAVNFELTRLGAMLVEDAYPDMLKYAKRIDDALNEEEKAIFIGLINRIIEATELMPSGDQ